MKGTHRLRTQEPSLTSAVKLFVIHVSEFLGLFLLSAWLFRKRLHILCYHGFEIQDECEFRPQLFISHATFEGRLRYIAKQGFSVLKLGDALEQLRSGSLPNRALVITIDDGFKSTLSVASPLLTRFELPATVYVTTYYVDKQVPIFRLAVQYAFWKASGQRTDTSMLASLIGSNATTHGWTDVDSAMWSLVELGEALGTEQERQQLLAGLAQALNVDLNPLRVCHLLSLMSAEELQILPSRGIDVQLHTHRHRFPKTSRAIASLEIEENRTRLRDATGFTPQHFCYPSGIYDARQWPWLEGMGVVSATTCVPGLNGPNTPAYGLTRFLDSESIGFIEFKAELSGFNEILRYFKKVLNPRQREIVPAAN